jgi:hypothetical protein
MEFYSGATGLSSTGSLTKTENVRYYLFASFPHGAGTAPGFCQQPQEVGEVDHPGTLVKRPPKEICWRRFKGVGLGGKVQLHQPGAFHANSLSLYHRIRTHGLAGTSFGRRVPRTWNGLTNGAGTGVI